MNDIRELRTLARRIEDCERKLEAISDEAATYSCYLGCDGETVVVIRASPVGTIECEFSGPIAGAEKFIDTLVIGHHTEREPGSESGEEDE